MYATIEDLTCRFGETRIMQLSDKACQKTGQLQDKLVQAKLDDACAEMDVILSCCYDICALLELKNDGYIFPVLIHWQTDIALKHLYDCVKPPTSKVEAEYKDYEVEIQKLCECGQLMAYKKDEAGNVIECLEVPKKYLCDVAVSGDDNSCLPDPCCCNQNPCGCGCD